MQYLPLGERALTREALPTWLQLYVRTQKMQSTRLLAIGKCKKSKAFSSGSTPCHRAHCFDAIKAMRQWRRKVNNRHNWRQEKEEEEEGRRGGGHGRQLVDHKILDMAQRLVSALVALFPCIFSLQQLLPLITVPSFAAKYRCIY